ncbi:MAG: T9SS type A sorting domain-containing protein [Bacteroidota bacterium]|nr:T9SS type A sorting domain-containing protein [Bacteroidota bacterium]
MKKQLLTIFSAIAVSATFAQVVSPSWQTLQNTSYTMAASASCKFLDVVSPSVVWGVGYSGAGVSANFNDFTRSTNAGVSFSGGNIYPDTNTYVVANLEGIDANTAWVSAYEKLGQNKGAIHKTVDGGATWTNMTAPGMYTNAAAFCNVVAFTTPSVGITMGDPNAGNANEFEIWRTADAGATWTIVPGANIPNPTSGEYGLVNIYTKWGTSNFWFGTNKGRIFRSTDAGLTWNAAVLPGTPTASLNVNDIAFTTSLTGIAYVYNSSTTPSTFEEYVTSDGGATWTKITTIDPMLGRNDVCAVPGTNIFVSTANTPTVANAGLSYTKDNGVTWTSFGSNGIPYLQVDFFDQYSGWAGTFQSALATGGIYKFNGPTSIFSLPSSSVCLVGPTATMVANNMSIGNTGTYTWTAIGGPGVSLSSSTATNPTITYTANGTYTISLLSSNAFTTNTSSQVVTVVSCVAPTAAFNMASSTCTGAAISSTNTTTGSATLSYTWSVNPSTGVTITPNAIATNPSFNFANANTYTITLNVSNPVGNNSTTKTVTVSTCVGLTENSSLVNNVKLYPNPTKDLVTVSLPHSNSEYNLTITDILGSIIYNQKTSKNSNEVQLNLSGKSNGIYFITIEGNSEKITKKIIVE